MNHQHASTFNGRSLLKALSTNTNLQDLYHANLDSCGLTTFPDDVLRLTHLSILSLFDNQLAEIPDSISQLSRLRSLNLAQNRLTAVPDNIGKLEYLEMLDLGHNHLAALPGAVGQLA
ncbi:MAG: hypothetical protein P8183_24170, partial [Anaerolineae bacterium]